MRQDVNYYSADIERKRMPKEEVIKYKKLPYKEAKKYVKDAWDPAEIHYENERRIRSQSDLRKFVS